MSKLTCNAQVFDFNPNVFTDTNLTELGSKAVTQDGRAFRYVKAGTSDLVVGTLIDAPATDTSNFANMAVAANAAAGSKTISITSGVAVTAGKFVNGTVTINAGAGLGYTYTIKSHNVLTVAGTLILTLDDSETVQIALTSAASKVTILINPWNGVKIHAQTEDSVPLGVAVAPIVAGQYGWIQTRGTVSCLGDGSAAAIGNLVAASTTTDGCITGGVATLATVGIAIVASVSTEKRPIFLTLD